MAYLLEAREAATAMYRVSHAAMECFKRHFLCSTCKGHNEDQLSLTKNPETAISGVWEVGVK
jgi:hypothetical protein